MKTATMNTPVAAALELLAAAEQRIVDADQAAAKADAYRDGLDLQLRDGADSISADDLLHADAECRRAAMIALHARDALGPAQAAVDRAELAAAISDARDATRIHPRRIRSGNTGRPSGTPRPAPMR